MVGSISKLTKVYALPSTEHQSTIRYRDGDTASRQRSFYMRRHVIWSFHIVGDEGHVFRDDMIEEGFKIDTNGWICIFIDCDAGRGMFYEKMEDAFLR